MANSSMSFTETYTTSGSIKKIKAVWLSDDANGTCSKTTTYAYDGQLMGAITVPGAGTPANQYNVTIKDSDSVDIALGGLLLRSNVATQYVNGSVMAGAAASVLNINVSGAGNATNGIVYLYFR
jgi:hypothetical protein